MLEQATIKALIALHYKVLPDPNRKGYFYSTTVKGDSFPSENEAWEDAHKEAKHFLSKELEIEEERIRTYLDSFNPRH